MSETVETLRREAEAALHDLLAHFWDEELVGAKATAVAERFRALGRAEGAAEMQERCVARCLRVAANLDRDLNEMTEEAAQLFRRDATLATYCAHAVRALSPATGEETTR